MKQFLITILLILIGNFFITHCFAKPYSAQQVLAYTRIAKVRVSPNGKQVAYVSWKRATPTSDYWQYSLNLINNHQHTSQIASSSYIGALSWSPNGKNLTYVESRGSKTLLVNYTLSTQKHTTITRRNNFISAVEWSPSGKQLAFVSSTNPPKKTNQFLNTPSKPTNSQLFLITNPKHPKNVVQVTPANINIAASIFSGGFSWSTNSRKIAFAFQPSAKTIDSSKSKVALLNLATHKFSVIPYCDKHSCNSPMYSPNGQWLAFNSNILSSGKKKALLQSIYTQSRTCVMNQNGKTHCLANTPNGAPQLLGWNENTKAVYVADISKTFGPEIYELNLTPGPAAKQISTQKSFIDPMTLSINRTNTTFSFAAESANKAPEVYTASTATFKLKRLTHINSKFDQPLGHMKVLNWTSSDGTAVQGLLVTPTNYNPHHRYPLYVDVHGGPAHAQGKRYIGGCDEYSEEIPPTTCTANILGLGYIILEVNYRGSYGYGVKFRTKNFQTFGIGDYNDIISGIKLLLHRKLVNPKNIVIAGWSYGGYMAAWAVSQSHLFRTAIDGDGITNFTSYTGTSDDTDFFLRYFGGYYWQKNLHQLYWQQSPLAHVKAVTTPLLIIQGEQDSRVPPTQAHELYQALTLLHRPVKLLLASKQGHVPSDPITISKEIQQIDLWLEKHSTPKSKTKLKAL